VERILSKNALYLTNMHFKQIIVKTKITLRKQLTGDKTNESTIWFS
jgi:hypothetical protein